MTSDRYLVLEIITAYTPAAKVILSEVKEQKIQESLNGGIFREVM